MIKAVPKITRKGGVTKAAAGLKRTRVSLDTKNKPRQDRSQSTYDAILRAAGELLEEVGIERLSTNLVCKRAGLTPPALYRYFPNKYALLKELGAQLMKIQDDAVYSWQDQVRSVRGRSVRVAAEKTRQILTHLNKITREFPGGGWVMRALRAVPTLSQVRIQSRESVAVRDYESLVERYPNVDKRVLRIAATLCVEVLYASMELVIDQPELDADLITQEISHMTALYLDSFGTPREGGGLAK
jgi:AcrR family transcriptional regulator